MKYCDSCSKNSNDFSDMQGFRRHLKSHEGGVIWKWKGQGQMVFPDVEGDGKLLLYLIVLNKGHSIINNINSVHL